MPKTYKSVFVTGLSGFVGRNLQKCMPLSSRLLFTERLDVKDLAAIEVAFAENCPDAVIHMAGQTFIPTAFSDPHGTFEVNFIGTLNLLQALKKVGFSGRFLYVSSGDVYGQVPESDLPIREDRSAAPRNPYAVSKASAELLCLQWGMTEQVDVMVARPFNHIGIGQRADFIVPSVAKQLISIGRGLQPSVLEVGDIDVSRDFLDVRDVISAYFALLDRGQTGQIYNVCSGVERTVRSLIETLGELAQVDYSLVQDPARLRPSDQRRVVGNAQKIQEHTGWKPEISMEESLQSVLSDWALRVV